MGQSAMSPAIRQAAETRGLGDYVRGYTAVYRASDKPPPTKGAEALKFVAILAALALPLVLSLLVTWWLGVVLLAGYAVVLTVYLRKPVKQVHEFRDGVVAETKDGLATLRWDETTAIYQDVSQFFTNGVYGSTNHTYRVVTTQGGHVTFGGSINEQTPSKSLTDIDELAEILMREIPQRRLQPALTRLNGGEAVQFDKLTITQQALTTPVATTPWHEVTDLATGAGHLAVHTATRKPWQIKIAEIPNFPVFWTLAKELRARAVR